VCRRVRRVRAPRPHRRAGARFADCERLFQFRQEKRLSHRQGDEEDREKGGQASR